MYIQDKLSNGMRIVSKEMPEMRSVSVGVWINTGSAFETKALNGVSHFIEHMLFKGTENRTAKDLADEIDGIGGQINAFTSKECTCYYVKVLDTHLDLGIDVLSDMIKNSKFDEKEIIKEKKIVFDEIALYEDSPEDVAYDLLAEALFSDNGLGQPILGTEESLGALSKAQIQAYLKREYRPSNMVISVAGSYKREELLNLLENHFGTIEKTELHEPLAYETGFRSNVKYRFKDIEQHHLCIGLPGVAYNEADIYPIMVLNNLLGGGTSSRLFQNVREEKGLAYSIFSHPSQYKEIGLMTIYASFVPDHLDAVTNAIEFEINQLLQGDISLEELERSKEQLKGNYILGLESTGSIMTMLGKSQLLTNRIETLDEVINAIDAVEISDLKRMIHHVFGESKVSVALVGRVNESDAKKVFKQFKSIS